MHFTCGFSRREFLARTSCFGAFYALAMRIPLPALAADLADDPRISQTPLVDKGFAALRKIGNGLYATISDYSKGTTTVCNGGFLIGKDAALLRCRPSRKNVQSWCSRRGSTASLCCP